ncbi:MAG: DUF2971 domain-containing protein [Nitrospinae bacterium]|nr:DUF2971 domain-containing protein [Nitrospinota bacterium]
MAKPLEPKEFYESHPWPDKCSINSLFRFYKIDLDRVEYLRHLFTERKLYHSLPSQFNDPFECKPHFNWPEDASKVRNIRQHLIKLSREKGFNEQEAEEIASKNMENPKLLQSTIYDSIIKTFAQMRICSFTTRNDNLLFWSHYADSHKGFCVEFDATKLPISYAFKVQYENKFPKVIYPSSNDETDLIPLLVKSEVWKYEEEFRTIFVPWGEDQPANDGESLILEGDEIKNVYLGSNIDENNKKLVIDLVKHGNFNPGIWTTSLAKSTFSLEFAQVG